MNNQIKSSEFHSRFDKCEQSLVLYDKVKKQHTILEERQNQIQSEIEKEKIEIPDYIEKAGCAETGCGCLSWLFIFGLIGIPFEGWDGEISTTGFFVSIIGSTIIMYCLLKLYLFIRKRIWLLKNGSKYSRFKEKESAWNDELGQIEKQMEEQKQMLSSLYSSTLGELYMLFTIKEISVPIPGNSITKENFDFVVESFLKIANSLRQINQVTPLERMTVAKRLADEKLELFCKVSLRKEANDNAYNLVMPQGTFNPKQFRGLAATGFCQDKQNSRIVDCENLLNNNRIESILNKLERVKNRDVSGFLGLYTDTDKLSEQFQDMKKLRDAAHEEYEELGVICDELSDTLDHLRTYAFQNIYLGVELLNVIRQGAGGGNLEKETDMINIEDIDLSLYSVSFQGYKTNHVSDTIKKFDNVARIIVNNKNVRQFIYSNKKVATGAALIGVATMAMSAAADHAAKVDRIQANQANIVKDMQVIVDGYAEGRAQLYRVIEVAQSIVKANNGFMHIYNQLKTKVFDRNQMLTLPEIQDLCKAIKSYKEISNSKI